MANSDETSRTESEMMGDSICSTPAPTKRVEENDTIRMMKMLFNEQSIKFDTFNEKLNQFDVQFSEIKKEIKKQSCRFDERSSETGTKLEKIELEKKKLELNKFELNKDKVSSGENYDNRIKSMVLENNCVSIESGDKSIMGVEFDNEVIKSVDELERKYRENLQIKGLQGVNFSRNVVVGGEEKASRAYLGDKKSANSCPWIFCAPDRWCSDKVVESPAYIERESVTWCYGEGYFESERYCDERERKREIEIFKVNRNYKEFVERLGVEMIDNKSKYLPWVEADIAVGEDDNGNNDFITYRVVTNYTGGDKTCLLYTSRCV